MSVTDRIAKLRKLMEERKMDAYISHPLTIIKANIVGSNILKARSRLSSGFTGSAGNSDHQQR